MQFPLIYLSSHSQKNSSYARPIPYAYVVGVSVVFSVCNIAISFIYIMIISGMKAEMDDSNYEAMISKLAKGSIDDKAQSLKKLLFLYQNARSRIYLYERRITECLELSLLIEEKDISLSALTLLEKIIINTSAESDLMAIIRKRLLSKVVLNLGSIEVAIRKVSHKCVLEYVRKFRDLETVMGIYLKTAMQQNQNFHLKLKAINSFHSLLMAETKHFTHDLQSSRGLLEELTHASYQKEYHQIRRAALISLIFVMRVPGVETSIQQLSSQAQSQLLQLRYQNQELAFILDVLFKNGKSESDNVMENNQNEHDNNTPSPKFISIQETAELKTLKESPADMQLDKMERIPQVQLKIFNEVSFAEEFLKKLQKNQSWEFNEIESFAPFLQKCLVDESIKLFSISKKIVEVIFNSEDGKKKEYYVVLVPCIVNGIGNKRFIVRKNLDKLVRQYIKNHTEVWVRNFVERFALTKNCKVKEILIDLMAHAYKTSPEFYYPTQRTFEVFDCEMNDPNSTLKRKLIDCILLIIQRQGKDDKNKEELLQIFSADPYSKIVRKMGKTNNSIGSLSDEADPQTLEPLSPIAHRKQRKQRLVTAEPEKLSRLEKSEEKEKFENVSEEKYKPRQLIQYSRQRRVRNSQIQINFKAKKDRRSKDQKTSLQRLPELKKAKNSSTSKYQANQSPVKRSMGERNITYIEREGLKPLENPQRELQRALVDIKDGNWSVQFDSINKIRSIVQFHSELLTDETLGFLVGELLQCIGNLRSGVTKLALMCLNEMMRKFTRRLYSCTENIVLTVIKKSITTSEFMQDEIRKCISTSVEVLCLPKMMAALNSVKDSRSNDIKLTFLLFVEGMIRSEKIYRKEFEWIWGVLTELSEEPQFNLRAECKRLVKVILENYKDWKNDVVELPKEDLERIDKLLKNLNQKGQNNLWIEIQNHEFEKIILGKIMTSKYFASNYNKFEDLDKAYTLKKNWKDRIKLLNDIFHLAFEYPQEFQANQNIKKYFAVAIDHLDDKNPGLLINSLTLLQKSLDVFPAAVEDCLPALLQRTVSVFQTRRGELIAIANKMLGKLYARYDVNKLVRQYLKLLVGTAKSKPEILSQLIMLLKDSQQRQTQGRSIRQIPLDRNSSQNTQTTVSSSNQGILIKSLTKICSEKNSQLTINCGNRIKELITICQRRFGPQFSSKIMGNAKIMELMS